MVDDIAQAATSLKDLNESAKAGEEIFKGYAGSLIRVAASTEGAGKAWTTFSRLTSGTGIWKVQNKVRAYLSILAGFQTRALKSEKASRDNNKAVVDSIVGLDNMKEEMEKMNLVQKKITAGSLDAKGELIKYTAAQIEAIQSTDSYASAILSGKKGNDAFAEGVKDLNKLYIDNKFIVDGAMKQRKEELKLNEMLDDQDGRSKLKQALKKEEIEAKSKSAFFRERRVGDKPSKDGLVLTLDNIKPLFIYGKWKSGYDAKHTKKRNKKRRKQFLKDVKSFGVGKGFFRNLSDSFLKIKENTGLLGSLAKTYSAVSILTSKMGIKFRKTALKLIGGITPLLNLAFKGFVFLILGIILFMVFAKIAYEIFEVIKEFGVIDDISAVLTSVVTIVGNVFSILGAFMDGDFKAMFDYLNGILEEVLKITYHLALAAAKIGFAVLVGLFYSIIDFIDYFFIQEGWRVVLPALLKVGGILLTAYFVKWAAGQALLLLGIYALPIGMAIVVAAAVVALYKKLEPYENWVKILLGAVLLIVGFFLGGWIAVIGVAIGLLISALADKFKFFAKATGGTSHGGMTLVGEQGPELVNLPAGAQVKTNSQTNRMMGGTTVNNYITINAKDTSKAEMRRIANELGNMINSKMNRTGATRTMR